MKRVPHAMSRLQNISGRKFMTVSVTNGKPRKAMASKTAWKKWILRANEKNKRTKNKKSTEFAIGPTDALMPAKANPRKASPVESGECGGLARYALRTA